MQLDAPAEVRIARAVREEGIDLSPLSPGGVSVTRTGTGRDVRAVLLLEPMAIDRYHLVLNTGLLDLDTLST